MQMWPGVRTLELAAPNLPAARYMGTIRKARVADEPTECDPRAAFEVYGGPPTTQPPLETQCMRKNLGRVMAKPVSESKAQTSTVKVPWAGRRGYFDLLLAASCVILIISNIGATKGVAFGPLPFELPVIGNTIVTDGGFFLFPLAYVIGDLLSEVYGFKRARRAIVASFVAAAFAAVCFLVIMYLPAAEFYENQKAFESVLGPVWQIYAGSLLGYLCGQTLNAWIMVSMKKATKGRFLWLRMILSTLAGELVDTVIFCSIAAPVLGIDTIEAFLNYVLVGYVYKCLVEVILMPISYPVIGWFKRHELEHVA